MTPRQQRADAVEKAFIDWWNFHAPREGWDDGQQITSADLETRYIGTSTAASIIGRRFSVLTLKCCFEHEFLLVGIFISDELCHVVQDFDARMQVIMEDKKIMEVLQP